MVVGIGMTIVVDARWLECPGWLTGTEPPARGDRLVPCCCRGGSYAVCAWLFVVCYIAFDPLVVVVVRALLPFMDYVVFSFVC